MTTTIYTREFVTPSVVASAEARQRNYELRLKHRKITQHADVVESHPGRIKHYYREVPPSTYFTRRVVNESVVELCVSKRDGTPVGKPFRCRLDRFDQVVQNRRIYPVLIEATMERIIFHLPSEQWLVFRAILTARHGSNKRRAVEAVPTRPEPVKAKDPLIGLHGKRFRSFRDLIPTGV